MARSFKAIVGDMNTVSKVIFNDIIEYCRKNDTSFEDFMATVPPLIMQGWVNDPQLLDWLTPPAKASRNGRQWEGLTATEEKDQIVALMSGKFIVSEATGGAWHLYAITDPEQKLVRKVEIDNSGADFTSLVHVLRDEVAQDGLVFTPERIKKFYNTFKYYTTPTPIPIRCAQPDEDTWCLHRITIRPDATVEFPHIQTFLDRLDDPKAFSAWLWGIYSRAYRGRQILWVTSEGLDGKSTFFKMFGEAVFGNAFGPVMPDDIEHNPAFFMENLVDKRFIYVPDNNNPNLLMKAAFKQIASAGADLVTVNGKFKKAYQAHLDAGVAVLSNSEPAMVDERHNRSRTLCVVLDPLTTPVDDRVPRRMRAELPGFLAYARDCFEEVCPDGLIIQVNDAVQHKEELRISDTSMDKVAVFENLFTLEEGEILRPTEMVNALKSEGLRTAYEQSNFLRWLKNTHGIKKQGKPHSYNGIRLRNSKDERSEVLENVARKAKVIR